MNPFARLEAAYSFVINRSRAGSPRFDHFWKARARYSGSFGPRLAAAIAYYGFFAAFAVGLLGYSVLGFVLGGNPAVLRTVDGYLAHNLPFLSPAAIQNARKTVAIVGLIGLVFAGIGWIDSMRSSQRAMWGLKQQPGNLVVRRLIDLAILIGLGLLLAGALWLSAGIRDLTRLVLEWISVRSPGDPDGGHGVLYWLGQVLTVLVNLLMSAGLLVAVPRLRISPRRIVGPILLVGLGLSVLTTLGRVYITHTEDNPAYAVAGTAVGLLVFLNLFSQLLLFAAALAATSRHGTVTDLARDEDSPAAEPARAEPARAEPARAEPARAEPASAEPA
ncbi:YihY/virulence factor BrkB family protein, partial [Rugosimonospora africana]|uniref:YihY/virulence factor BrkB family protein n=1 Tax=Rugosimonospora africana TaxID=556532 RepID=UPI001940FF41